MIVAEKFSDKAADMICEELGLEHSVDWIDYVDRTEIFNRPFAERPWSRRNYIVLTDLDCGKDAYTFDDCKYNITTQSRVDALPHIILSCNPKPGKIL